MSEVFEVFSNADSVYEHMVKMALRGTEVVVRGQKSWEIMNYHAMLRNPRARLLKNPRRGIREAYAAASVCWNLAERDDVDGICWWNENGRRISDNGKTFFGANYGARMTMGLDLAIELLNEDPYTRRAWVPIWRPEDIETGYSSAGKDVPCTLGFWLRARQSDISSKPFLDMHVVMRSQAANGVFPYDVFLLTVYQELVANELGWRLGEYHHHCLSAHVFERELAQVEDSLLWYDERRKKQGGAYDPDWKNVFAPMLPLGFNLSEARARYSDTFEAMMDETKIDEEFIGRLDDFEIMMLDYAIRRHGES